MFFITLKPANPSLNQSIKQTNNNNNRKTAVLMFTNGKTNTEKEKSDFLSQLVIPQCC